ncbi:unnamed protein product [Dicrocoelium dendriticum]|nr:unnamed protein product [Dicrocoelium dendriticum]
MANRRRWNDRWLYLCISLTTRQSRLRRPKLQLACVHVMAAQLRTRLDIATVVNVIESQVMEHEQTTQSGSRNVPVSQRALIIRLYGECGVNAASASRKYNAMNAGMRPLTARYVLKLMKKFEQTGSVCDMKRTGPPRIATDDRSACAVVSEVSKSPDLSIRRIAQHCDTTRYAVHRILLERKFRRFRALQLQVLNPCDPEKRHEFCRCFLDHGDICSVILTDEALFHLHGTRKLLLGYQQPTKIYRITYEPQCETDGLGRINKPENLGPISLFRECDR